MNETESQRRTEKQIRIVADSSVDLSEVPGVCFAVAPLTVSTDEKSFLDDDTLQVDEMLTYLASYKGRSYTACPNVDAWLSCYEGADVLYVVVLSSGISGTYNAAMTAAELYQEHHPEAEIRVFDTRSAGPEVRLLVEKIASWILNGKDFTEVCRLADGYMKCTRVFFALESFHNFAQNGRVSPTVAKLAGLLDIRIMATASPAGQIEIVKKCRGEHGTRRAFLDCMKEAGYTGGKCCIAHCKNPGLAEEIAKDIRNLYPDAEISIGETRGLCSFYAEKGGILLSCECGQPMGDTL